MSAQHSVDLDGSIETRLVVRQKEHGAAISLGDSRGFGKNHLQDLVEVFLG